MTPGRGTAGLLWVRGASSQQQRDCPEYRHGSPITCQDRYAVAVQDLSESSRNHRCPLGIAISTRPRGRRHGIIRGLHSTSTGADHAATSRRLAVRSCRACASGPASPDGAFVTQQHALPARHRGPVLEPRDVSVRRVSRARLVRGKAGCGHPWRGRDPEESSGWLSAH